MRTLNAIRTGKTVRDDDVIKIDGTDERGFDRRVEIADDIPSLFGGLDHDTVVKDPTTFGLVLKDAYPIKTLLEVAKASPSYFGS